MKQTDEKKLAEARETLERLREARGGSISGGHRQLANDPALLKALPTPLWTAARANM